MQLLADFRCGRVRSEPSAFLNTPTQDHGSRGRLTFPVLAEQFEHYVDRAGDILTSINAVAQEDQRTVVPLRDRFELGDQLFELFKLPVDVSDGDDRVVQIRRQVRYEDSDQRNCEKLVNGAGRKSTFLGLLIVIAPSHRFHLSVQKLEFDFHIMTLNARQHSEESHRMSRPSVSYSHQGS